MKNSFKNLFLIILSSLLFALANPNFVITSGLGFLAWFYYLPVLILVKRNNYRKTLVSGFLYGVLSYFLYSLWMFKSYRFFFLIVCIAYGLILMLVFLFLKLADRLFNRTAWIIQWLILCAYEFLHTLGFLGFNYGITAYTQYNYKVLIQITRIIGPFGLNLIIIFTSCWIFNFLNKKKNQKKMLFTVSGDSDSGISRFKKEEAAKKQFSLTGAFITLPVWSFCFLFTLVFGIVQLHTVSEYKKIKVAAIQSNDDPWANGIKNYSDTIYTLMALSEEAISFYPDIDLIVWPETAVVPAIVYHYENTEDSLRNFLILNLLNYINSRNQTFVIGNGHKIKSYSTVPEIYNSALVFTPEKNVLPPKPEIYSKIHLVPFTETFPMKNYFPSIYRTLINSGNQMWTPGLEYKVFNLNDFYFSTPICFEDTFTDTGRKMYLNGARAFLNLSNDSWANSKACQMQHFALAVFRSVENGVPTVRSTTSGKTCIINRKGKVIKEADDFCASYVVGDIDIIPENKKAGFYTRAGDYCGWFSLVCSVLLLLIKIFISIINKNRKHK